MGYLHQLESGTLVYTDMAEMPPVHREAVATRWWSNDLGYDPRPHVLTEKEKSFREFLRNLKPRKGLA